MSLLMAIVWFVFSALTYYGHGPEIVRWAALILSQMWLVAFFVITELRK